MPAGRYRRWFSPGNYLTGETATIDHPGGAIPFDRSALPGSYILEFVDVSDRTFVYRDPPSGRRAILDCIEVPYFTLWSDGGPFLCVEPCWGLTDRHEQRAFEDKDGIQQIAPGGGLDAGFTIVPAFRRFALRRAGPQPAIALRSQATLSLFTLGIPAVSGAGLAIRLEGRFRRVSRGAGVSATGMTSKVRNNGARSITVLAADFRTLPRFCVTEATSTRIPRRRNFVAR